MDYGKFLSGLDPIILGLNSSTFSLNRKAYWSRSANPRRVLESKYSLATVADDYFDVEASFSVALEESDSEGPVVQALKIECVFYGHFHTTGPVDREHARKFTETESWLIFWPFFRQFISDTTARMHIPPITVPLALGPGTHSHSFRRKTTPQNQIEQGRPALSKKSAKRSRSAKK